MDLQEVAAGLAERVGGKAPLGGTLKFDLGEAGCLFVDGDGSGNTVTANKNDPAGLHHLHERRRLQGADPRPPSADLGLHARQDARRWRHDARHEARADGLETGKPR